MMSKISDQDCLNEGFKPLRRKPSEPVQIPSKSSMQSQSNDIFVNADTGGTEHSQGVWESSSILKMEKNRGKVLERGNSFVGYRSRGQDSFIEKDKGVIVIIDPFSTGAMVACAVTSAGYKCARIFSIWNNPVSALVQEGLVLPDFCATIQHNDNLEDQNVAIDETIAALKALPYRIVAVIPGAETGVDLADKVSFRMGLRSNGEINSAPRRNKYLMGEAVRCAGIRSVKQSICTSMLDLNAFLMNLGDGNKKLKCVVKPVQSAGSDDVYLCNDAEEANEAFQRIFMKTNGLGLLNDSVLVQEFLSGQEYVVDQISRDGVHKVVAIWQYDKRSVNGAAFVYYGQRLLPSDSEKCQEMVLYAEKVLDALGIFHGPSHMEIIYCDDGPCLVEVGSRCQGGEGAWVSVAEECIGYTQVSVTVDVYGEGKLFDTLPDRSYVMRKAGRIVDMVSKHSGIIRSYIGEDFIRSLTSFRKVFWHVKIGDFAEKTTNCFNTPGTVLLVSDTEEEADADFEAIHDLDDCGLIDFSVICPEPPPVGAVVVVDPFSSGANMAAMAMRMGYKVILVFSEMDSPVAKLVSKSANFQPTFILQHNSQNPDQEKAIAETLTVLKSQSTSILAILPGAETGVDLADRLATRFGTRNNGEEKTLARRNKYLMQECIREAGIRAVTQKLCRSREEVDLFFSSLPGSLKKCVVKPNQSAGSDSVYMCNSLEETVAAFEAINGHHNGLGQLNDGALCQEFLSGTEFVIDGVSRDGIYKVLAIWEYDKRSVNGANFVYYGMRLRRAVGERELLMIEYSRKVIKALGIMHGPSHMEIMYSPESGPCLVEVGSRCHGGEASWLPVVQECLGYNMLEATLNCYLRPDRFEEIPAVPHRLLKEGCEAFLVSTMSGTIKDISGIEVIRSLSSFRRMEMFTQPGATLCPTIDCFTRPGSVQMVNDSAEQLDEDYESIRKLEISGLFELS